jgi:tetratricopeptide (TPR) repeat protein/energy-coupling factor transporter ATP-binding protein EcfA2
MNAPVQLLAASVEHPFPGLRPFAYQDHEYFFGRDDQKYALYRLIDRSRFVAVVGSSGSGKSSLVRAGLLPLLDQETREPGGHSWVWCEMRPGDAPLQRLTGLLAGLSSDDDAVVASGRRERIAAQLQRSSFGISEALTETKGITGKSLVLVVDQFEELFRYAAAGSARASPTTEDARARDEATQFVQLLLEASRAPLHNITVMLTMRSDFIGDCARFHGLPEAVCAAQFLVPSLTRDQLDEVIRLPLEKPGATIDPELVERLLNDCGTEMDQLPVLQHCLSRLWDEAGKSRAAATAPSPAPSGGEASDGVRTGRHLSLIHYRAIGEFSDALSLHADEILKDLGPKLLLAVTQVFSALSELDKEGRAVRRALRFSQLVAETGVDEAAVRQVLDRFRADDCSFLTPPRFEEIAPATRIDVGHEALLRRWEKVSGHGVELGWLRAEQQAGERYRGLLAMADGDATLPAHLVDERLAWWKARPRTAAWAERYGGGFERVERLLQMSQRKQRAKRWSVAAAFVAVAGLAIAMALLWQNAERAQTEAEASRKNALNSTRTSIGRLGGFLNDGTLSAKNAELLLGDARLTLEDLAKNENQSPEISSIEVLLLLSFSDVRVALGDHDDALKRAERAAAISERLLKRDPYDQNLMRQAYAASFRIGDRKAFAGDNREAERQYNKALGFARQRASIDPDNPDRKRDLVFIINKLADLEQLKKNWKTALDYYSDGLKIAAALADKYPIDTATQKNRIAQLLSERGEPGDAQAAMAGYREALAIQTSLLQMSPDDATLLSNAALTHRRIGQLLKDKPEEALIEFRAAVANRKKLFESDPASVPWRTGLAVDYKLLGDTLLDLEDKDYRGALQNYSAASQIEEGLVQKDPSNIAWQRTFAVTSVKRGDILIARGNEALVNPEPAEDETTRRFRDALVRYQRAAGIFEKLVNDPKAGSARFANLFDVKIKIGDVLAHQENYKEALESYQSALAMAATAPPSQRIVDWQIRATDAIAQACDFLAHEAAGGSATTAVAGNDRPDALACYQKASAAIEAAAVKDPENPEVKTRRAALSAKIEAQRSAAK